MHYQIHEPQTMKPTFDASEQKKIKLQENERSRIQPSKQMSREYYNSRNPNNRN